MSQRAEMVKPNKWEFIHWKRNVKEGADSDWKRQQEQQDIGGGTAPCATVRNSSGIITLYRHT